MSEGGEHLVSVGMPVYNRPDLLDRRLANVRTQTYKNLEIIVSDNASPDPQVETVARKHASIDQRVRYVRQQSNIGAWSNFAFVLDSSHGSYFAWAADDDEWGENFIEVCVAGIGEAQIFMPDMAVKYHKSGVVQDTPTPTLSSSAPVADNVKTFLRNMQPGLIYGLHDRNALLEIFDGEEYDMADVAVVFRAILAKGVQTGEGAKYSAGVPDDSYLPKPVGDKNNRLKFSYRKFLSVVNSSILKNRQLSLWEKLSLIIQTTSRTLKVISHLTHTYPSTARWHHRVYGFLRRAPVQVWRALIGRKTDR